LPIRAKSVGTQTCPGPAVSICVAMIDLRSDMILSRLIFVNVFQIDDKPFVRNM